MRDIGNKKENVTKMKQLLEEIVPNIKVTTVCFTLGVAFFSICSVAV